jgi:hypothetical protein
VFTVAATNVTTSSATLNGFVNPNGAPTGCVFAYGLTTTYGQTTPLQSVGNGTSTVPISATINGLTENTTYHYQLVCANSAGSFGFGGDQTLTTSSTRGRSSISIGKRKETVTNGVVKFRLNCRSSVACNGRFTLKTRSGKKLAKARAYSIAGGGAKVISVHLTKKGLARLTNAKHQRLKANARAVDNDGARAKRLVTLILK